MKKVFSILFIAVMSIGTLAAQDVDEIVENYLENIGGKDKWASMNTMMIQGKMSMQGMDLDMTIYGKSPNLQYVEINIMGKTIIEAFDGTTSWSVNPFQGGETAQKGTEEQTKEAAKDEFGNDFVDYKKKGSVAKLLGKEEVEGTECFKVLFITKEGDETTYFFDTENYVPIMTRSAITEEGPMKGKLAEAYFSDYLEVDGVMMAHFMESKIDGQTIQKMTYTKVEIDTPIEDSKFQMPK